LIYAKKRQFVQNENDFLEEFDNDTKRGVANVLFAAELNRPAFDFGFIT
jgi:hypothetical protein